MGGIVDVPDGTSTIPPIGLAQPPPTPRGHSWHCRHSLAFAGRGLVGRSAWERKIRTYGDCRWTMDSGQWTVDSGQWTVDSGQWTGGSGREAVDGRQWTVDSGQWAVGAPSPGPCGPPSPSRARSAQGVLKEWSRSTQEVVKEWSRSTQEVLKECSRRCFGAAAEHWRSVLGLHKCM
jgi:hypothetical protein